MPSWKPLILTRGLATKHYMKYHRLLFISILFISQLFSAGVVQAQSNQQGFDIENDLLLVHFDCKTDVDDLHTVAGLVTLLSDRSFSKVKYHAVAGTYGIQEGLYVPPNDLFQLAFENNWTDAHNDPTSAVERVKAMVKSTLFENGDVWIAEAGQSDFSAKVIKALQAEMQELDIAQRIHIVQHSNWNEEMTAPESLQFVKDIADYQKIPDGNEAGNGTPGFRSPGYTGWQQQIKDTSLLEIWKLAVALGTQYNGKEGRYNNKAVESGGLDFSDLSEVCWILGVADIADTEEFFSLYGK